MSNIEQDNEYEEEIIKEVIKYGDGYSIRLMGVLGFFGDSCEEWLQRWDDGKTVWSVSMGGMGPGYEDCIQNLAVETLRYFVENKVNLQTEDTVERDAITKGMDAVTDRLDKKYGFSGAQVGAARNLAAVVYRRGPKDAFSDPVVKGRLIRVRKL